MNLKNLMAGVAVAGSLALVSTTANALIIQDGWRLNDSIGTTTNIGHLVVSGGQSTITQELDAGGNIFVGAKFTDLGGLFTITYTPENCVGGCDFGAPGILAGGVSLDMVFSGLTGSITSINPDGSFAYNFDVGIGSMSLLNGPNTLATFAIASPSGGTLGNFNGAVNTSGTTNILAKVLTSDPGVFLDNSGAAFDSQIAAGGFFVALDMTNQIFTTASPVACAGTLAGAANCSSLVVTSQGKVDALTVPEPASLGLVGMALVGLAGLRRRRVVP